MAGETNAATASGLSLSDTDINWDSELCLLEHIETHLVRDMHNIRLDKTKFLTIGSILFTAQQALLHPTAVVKTRMQVIDSGISHVRGITVFKHLLRSDGIHGVFRGFGTCAIGSLPGRVLALTSLEVSKDVMMKHTHGLDVPEATRIAIANGVAGLLSNLVSSVYYVPLDVVCQRLMVQGLPGTTVCAGPLDAVHRVRMTDGIRGLFRGFGLTALTQPPASALWWGVYSATQHIIWRSLDYGNGGTLKKPSHAEIVTVQATAGMVAGACSSIITTPVDTVKTRLQVLDNHCAGRPSVLKTAKSLFVEDSWRGFYRGLWPRFLNMSLYGTTMIVTYELTKRLSAADQLR